jgi:hypothetical protein
MGVCLLRAPRQSDTLEGFSEIPKGFTFSYHFKRLGTFFL